MPVVKRFKNFDYFRGLAIIAVILIHITAPITGQTEAGRDLNIEPSIIAIVLNQLSRFAVPIFLLLSGWGLDMADAYGRSDSYVEFIWSRLRKIWSTYLIWNVVYALINFPLKGEPISFLQFLLNILRGSNSYHLYFVPLISILYLLYPVLSYIALNRLLMFSFVSLFLIQHIGDYWWPFIPYDQWQHFYTYSFFFVVGIWFSNCFEEKIKFFSQYKLIVYFILLVSALLVVGESVINEGMVVATTRPLVTIYSLALFLSVALINNGITEFWEKVLSTLGDHSYDIYLSHVLTLIIIEWLLRYSFLSFYPTLYILLAFAVIVWIYFIGKRMKYKIIEY
ncbi:acyltransferase [Facklamia lactis]|uniref:acyltransferase n=1 Tax=Facklamia lactis TaxID=2749967 RepID=UPI0018CF0EAB|nr:acyltransferase family protein [Facklamia lactis]MBG9979957.1 acyltransferase family protein [Facklamia lactis]